MITMIQPGILRALRYVHDRGIPKVLAEDLMTLQHTGEMPCGRETCLSYTIPFVAPGWKEIAGVFQKTGIIREE